MEALGTILGISFILFLILILVWGVTHLQRRSQESGALYQELLPQRSQCESELLIFTSERAFS